MIKCDIDLCFSALIWFLLNEIWHIDRDMYPEYSEALRHPSMLILTLTLVSKVSNVFGLQRRPTATNLRHTVRQQRHLPVVAMVLRAVSIAGIQGPRQCWRTIRRSWPRVVALGLSASGPICCGRCRLKPVPQAINDANVDFKGLWHLFRRLTGLESSDDSFSVCARKFWHLCGSSLSI